MADIEVKGTNDQLRQFIGTAEWLLGRNGTGTEWMANMSPNTAMTVKDALTYYVEVVKHEQERRAAKRVNDGEGLFEYRVSWEIDIAADSPKQAAETALSIQRDPTSIATVFHVQEMKDGLPVFTDFNIDLGDR